MKDKVRKFNRGHFPIGTVATIQIGKYDPVETITVTGVSCNGPKSWVLETGLRSEHTDVEKRYNIGHVTGIVKRGDGRLVYIPRNWREGDNFYRDSYLKLHQRVVKNKASYICKDEWSLMSTILDNWFRGDRYYDDHLFDIEGVIDELRKRQILTNDVYSWISLVSKKKIKRHLKRIIAHHKVSRSAKQREYYQTMEEIYERSYKEEMRQMQLAAVNDEEEPYLVLNGE